MTCNIQARTQEIQIIIALQSMNHTKPKLATTMKILKIITKVEAAMIGIKGITEMTDIKGASEIQIMNTETEVTGDHCMETVTGTDHLQDTSPSQPHHTGDTMNLTPTHPHLVMCTVAMVLEEPRDLHTPVTLLLNIVIMTTDTSTRNHEE